MTWLLWRILLPVDELYDIIFRCDVLRKINLACFELIEEVASKLFI